MNSDVNFGNLLDFDGGSSNAASISKVYTAPGEGACTQLAKGSVTPLQSPPLRAFADGSSSELELRFETLTELRATIETTIQGNAFGFITADADLTIGNAATGQAPARIDVPFNTHTANSQLLIPFDGFSIGRNGLNIQGKTDLTFAIYHDLNANCVVDAGDVLATFPTGQPASRSAFVYSGDTKSNSTSVFRVLAPAGSYIARLEMSSVGDLVQVIAGCGEFNEKVGVLEEVGKLKIQFYDL
ncbi:hypothetical protein [Engelhardtia mirabilis]|uniref:hypothetical protein n=1 Tax=Engelhardtia mirabilis TaxID=2528011 RepID=UPI003AF3FCF6